MKANKIKDLLKKNGFTQKSLAEFYEEETDNALKNVFKKLKTLQ